MHRLFVAIRPPAAIRERLIDLMDGVAGARWQDDEQLHLTLRFVGEIDAPQADDLAAALGQVHAPAFELALAALGTFERRGRPHTLWAGVAPPLDPLLHLQRKIEQACQRAGLAPEPRAFAPHVTLARLSAATAPLGLYLASHGDFVSPRFPVGHFGLYESHLGAAGSVYELVERYPLE